MIKAFKVYERMTEACDYNRQCRRKVIKGSRFCHLMSHYPSDEEYKTAIQNVVDNYMFDTISPDSYQIIDVIGDGACMYRCLSHALYSHAKLIRTTHIEIPEHMNAKDEDSMARKIQSLIKNWLCVNKDSQVESLGCTVEQLVLMTHEDISTIEEYSALFDIYAGDLDYLTIEQSDGSIKKVDIPFRWGGAAEQYAFTQLFNVSLTIYDVVKLDLNKLDIKNCTLRTMKHRFRQIQKFTCDISKMSVNLILTQTQKKVPHYMCAIDKYMCET